MNRQEHVLTCLAEECAEVAKEVSKALRFGLDDRLTRDPNGPRGTEGPTNREKIAAEMIDLLGVYRMAVKEGILPDVGLDRLPPGRIRTMDEKAARVEAYMGYARRVDALSAIPKLSEMACFAGTPDLPFRVLVEGPRGFSHFANGRTIEALVRGIVENGEAVFPPALTDAQLSAISDPIPVLLTHPDYPDVEPPVVTVFPKDKTIHGFLIKWPDGTIDRAHPGQLIPIFPPRQLDPAIAAGWAAVPDHLKLDDSLGVLREISTLLSKMPAIDRERYLEHARKLGVGPFPEDPNLVFPGGLAVEADGKVVTPARDFVANPGPFMAGEKAWPIGIGSHPEDPRVTRQLGRPTVWQYRLDGWQRQTWELFDMPTPGDPVAAGAPVLARVQFDAGNQTAGLWSWEIFHDGKEMIGGIVTDGGKDAASVGRLAATAAIVKLTASKVEAWESIPSGVTKDGRPLEWRHATRPDGKPSFDLVFCEPCDHPERTNRIASVWPDDVSTCWHLQTFEFLPMTGTEKDAAAARAGAERVFLSRP